MHEANRMRRLPPYLFTVVDKLKREARERGLDVIETPVIDAKENSGLRKMRISYAINDTLRRNLMYYYAPEKNPGTDVCESLDLFR